MDHGNLRLSWLNGSCLQHMHVRYITTWFFPRLLKYETISTLFCTLHCLIKFTTSLVVIDVCENKLKVYAAMGTPEAQPVELADTGFLVSFYRRFCCYVMVSVSK